MAEPTRLSVGDLIKMSETLLRVAPAGDRTQDAQRSSPADSGTLYRPAALIERSEILDTAPVGDLALRRQTNRLRMLNEVHRALASPISIEERLKLILDRIFAELIPEEAVVFMRDARGDFYRAATRRLPGVSGDFLYSKSLVHEVTEKQLAALVFDTSRDERFGASKP